VSAAPASSAAVAGALVVVVRPGDALGPRLAGVRVEEVAAGEEGPRLRELLADPAIALVALEAAVGAAAPAEPLRRAARRGRPVVVPFALPRALGDAAGGRDYVAALIRRFIGYHVKLGSGGAP
jgi:V/A-type H+-transporting ATPase subunit F